MSAIDWSKAPEGATHKDSGVFGLWYKFDFQRNTAAYWVERETKWRDSGPASAYNDGSLASMEARPSIRMREQTERAARTKACDQMFGVILSLPEDRRHNRSDIVEALYDAGYRKP